MEAKLTDVIWISIAAFAFSIVELWIASPLIYSGATIYGVFLLSLILMIVIPFTIGGILAIMRRGTLVALLLFENGFLILFVSIGLFFPITITPYI